MLTGLALACIPLFSAESAGADRDIILRVHSKLAALSYPVSPSETEWTSRSDSYVRRLLLRLGLEEKSLTPAEADQLLSSVPAESVPCLAVTDMHDAGVVLLPVSIRFSGDRPDEQLADFYTRFAECYPQYLRPEAFGRRPSPDAGGFEPSLAFPVEPTPRARRAYENVRKTLAAYLSDRGDMAESFAEPAVSVRKEARTEIVNLTAADGGGVDDLVESFRSAATPRRSDLTRACKRFGRDENCLAGRIEQVNDPETGTALAYLGSVDHFDLTLRLDLPKGLAGRMLVDAIDNMRRLDPRLRSPDAEMPFVDFGVRRTVPTSRDPHLFGDRNSSSATGRVGTKPISGWRDAVRWAPPPPSEGNVLVDLIVADPGFDYLQPQDIVPFDIKKKPPETGPVAKLAAIDEIKNKPEANKPLSDLSSKNELGHGIHVAYLISGSAADGDKFPAGLVAENRFVNVQYSTTKEWDDAIVSAASNGPARKFDFWGVVNRSYGIADLCNQNGENGGVGLDSALLSASEKSEHHILSKAEENSIPDAKNWFDVVAAHEFEANCRLPMPCVGSDSVPLVCLGKLSRGLAVAPLTLQDNAGWVVAETIADSKNTKPGATPAATRYDLYDGMLWIGAPAVGIVSGDVHAAGGRRNYGFRARSGSSMAAPIVSSLVARVKSKFPGMEWYDVKRWILSTSTPLAPSTADQSDNDPSRFVVGNVNFEDALSGKPSSVTIWFKGDCPDGLRILQPRNIGSGQQRRCAVISDYLHSNPKLSYNRPNNVSPWSPTMKRELGDPFAIGRAGNQRWRVLSARSNKKACQTDRSIEPCEQLGLQYYLDGAFRSADCWLERDKENTYGLRDEDACFFIKVDDSAQDPYVPLNFRDVSSVVWLDDNLRVNRESLNLQSLR